MLSLSQITAITGACGNASASIWSKAMKSAAQRRPSRYTQAPVVTSIAPSTVTFRFVPGVGTSGRTPRGPGPVGQPGHPLAVEPADPPAHGGGVAVQQRRDLGSW